MRPAYVSKGGVVETPTIDNLSRVHGGYNVMSLKAGENWQDLETALTAPVFHPDVMYPYAGCSGAYRLVGCGVEVVNTTPELYIGGSVTTYRSPSPKQRSMLIVPRSIETTPASTIYVPMGCDVTIVPPSLQRDAQLYPSSRTWGAKEGCYLIGTMNVDDVEYSSTFANVVSFSQQYTPAALASSLDEVARTRAWLPQNVVSHTALDTDSMRQVLPFDTHGAIFAGLQPQATLQITVRYFIERIPTISQPELLVLTRPPTPYDPMALEIYSRCMTHLPVGVMVKDNPLGEWFNDVMNFVAEAAPVVGNLVGTVVPGAGAVGQVVGSLAGRAAGVNSNAKARKKRKKQKKALQQNASKIVPHRPAAQQRVLQRRNSAPTKGRRKNN